MTVSLLSKKDRTLNVEAQVVKLVRIAKRSESKADWLDEILSGEVMSMELVDVPETTDERDRFRARAVEATDEIARVVTENPQGHWTLPQRRAAERWAAGR